MLELYSKLESQPKMKKMLNEESVKVHFNEKGSCLYNKVPLVKIEYLFPSLYSIDLILKSTHDIEERQKWDPNIQK